MELFEAIKQRYSYRGPFTAAPVRREDLVRIVQAGMDAPSGSNAQTTCFVVVDDPDTLQQIAVLPGANRAMQTARAHILCIVDVHPAPTYDALSFQVEDCAAATENMLLAITALGYASVWIDGWLRRGGRAEQIGQLIGLPGKQVVRVLLPVGVAAEAGARREKKPFALRAWFNRYGG